MKAKDNIDGFAMNPRVQEVQKWLIYTITQTELGWAQYKLLKEVVTSNILWLYGILFSILTHDSESMKDCSSDNHSTEIVKKNLAGQYIEMLSCTFYRSDVFEDSKFLIKEHIMNTQWLDDFERIVLIQQQFKKIDDIKAFDASKNYLIRELYDNAIWDLTEKAERKKKWKTLWYSTWFPLLDKWTEGIQKGTVTRLNAYSNVGKSKFSYQLVNKLLDQKAHVLYFSLEVQKNMVIYQLIANKYKMDIGQVYRMEFDNIDFGELFTKKLEIIDDKYKLSEILNYAELRQPDVIVIDFVQNIQSEWKTEYERMTNIAVAIQQLAIKHNIAVFDLSQVSNAGTDYAQGDAIPSKGSGALVASADVGLMMKKNKTDPNTIVLHIAKNKFWFNGKSIDYKVDFAKWLFTEEWESISNPF